MTCGTTHAPTTVAPASCRLSRGRLALGSAGQDARRTAAGTAALLPALNTERFPALLAAQQEIKNHSRYEYRRKQIRKQTERKRRGEPPYGTCAEDEQNCRRNDRCHVRINDRNPGVAEALIDCGWRRLAVTQ